MSDPDAVRLQLSVAATLWEIAAARSEREAPRVNAARRYLGAIHGATRLRKRLAGDDRAA
ncbi:hypothetical protein [Methylobacterium symbioticum]|jgi:hypothetical protein|uniref:Uncharacterized protein n=1 Tax=Methylobacterium symbioticum TaxID=2584084 RepID=A0A509EDE2_9HYPH|nr:hypothetical protein [Methylobacterium symbioticum]VUD72190.1 hypothetical protein MET9862_02785 [Methylobacterium symbioticum]